MPPATAATPPSSARYDATKLTSLSPNSTEPFKDIEGFNRADYYPQISSESLLFVTSVRFPEKLQFLLSSEDLEYRQAGWGIVNDFVQEQFKSIINEKQFFGQLLPGVHLLGLFNQMVPLERKGAISDLIENYKQILVRCENLFSSLSDIVCQSNAGLISGSSYIPDNHELIQAQINAAPEIQKQIDAGLKLSEETKNTVHSKSHWPILLAGEIATLPFIVAMIAIGAPAWTLLITVAMNVALLLAFFIEPYLTSSMLDNFEVVLKNFSAQLNNIIKGQVYWLLTHQAQLEKGVLEENITSKEQIQLLEKIATEVVILRLTVQEVFPKPKVQASNRHTLSDRLKNFLPSFV